MARHPLKFNDPNDRLKALGDDLLAREKDLSEQRVQHERDAAMARESLEQDASLARDASAAATSERIKLQQKANELLLEEKQLEGLKQQVKAAALAQLQVLRPDTDNLVYQFTSLFTHVHRSGGTTSG